MLLVGVGIHIGQGGGTPDRPGPSAVVPVAPAAPDPRTPSGFAEFREPKAGIALSYPQDWVRLQPADPQVVLLAVKNPGYSMLVRELDLQTPIDPGDMSAAKALADKMVLADKTIIILSQQQIVLAGLPGYYYLYSFSDPVTGQLAVHSHFFVFKDRKMISFVFQVIPSDKFGAAAGTFDRITASVRII